MFPHPEDLSASDKSAARRRRTSEEDDVAGVEESSDATAPVSNVAPAAATRVTVAAAVPDAVAQPAPSPHGDVSLQSLGGGEVTTVARKAPPATPPLATPPATPATTPVRAMSVTSVMVGESSSTPSPPDANAPGDDSPVTTDEEDEMLLDQQFDAEMLQSRSLYAGKLLPRIEDVDDDEDENEQEQDSELRHVYDILSVSAAGRQCLKREGVRRVSDIDDIEDLLRHAPAAAAAANGRGGLGWVDRTRLLQFLAWTKAFQAQHDDGGDDGAPSGGGRNLQRDFTAAEYESHLECTRSTKQQQQQRDGGASRCTWPFGGGVRGADGGATSVLLLPVAYDLPPRTAAATAAAAAAQSYTPRDRRSARIRALFGLAEEAHERFHTGRDGGRSHLYGLKEAIANYRLVVREVAVTSQDCMLQAFSCIKLAILLHRIEYQNHREAMSLLETAAVRYKVPTGMFFYGSALVTGHGGLVPNVPAGVAMLQDAASAGIGEAYYVLGVIHETGDGGDRDLNAARQYYETASHAFLASVRFADSSSASQASEEEVILQMEGVPAAASAAAAVEDGAFPTIRGGAHDADEAYAPGHWDVEFSEARGLVTLDEWRRRSRYPRAAALATGEHGLFPGGLLLLLAQALLVGAAAVLSRTTQASHYPALLPLVPILGAVLAAAAAVDGVAAAVQRGGNGGPRQLRRQVQDAKLTAYQRLLQVSPWHRAVLPPLHYPLLWYYKLSRWFHGRGNRTSQTVELLEANILWLEARDSIFTARFWAWLAEALALLVAASFVVAWLVLLVQEVDAYRDDCSNWWDSTCQGSAAVCNEGIAQLETCGSDASTTDFSTYNFRLVPV